MNPMVILHFVAGAHNDSLMVAAICLALWLALTNRTTFSIVVAALAVGIKPVAIVVLPFIALILAGQNPTRRSRIYAVLRVAFTTGPVLIFSSALVGVGAFGWIGALATPGSVRSWLSPITAIGMMWGGFIQIMGLGNHTDVTITITRVCGALALGVLLVGLVLRPTGRSATRGAAEAFLLLVLLGPVAQPWYLLWAIPLFASTGLSRNQLRAAILVTCGFTIHGLANWSATADTFFELSDGLAILISIATLALAILTSAQERGLILGKKIEHGLSPKDDAARMRAQSKLL
jgi:alpha-1,6-mannosyltransferase